MKRSRVLDIGLILLVVALAIHRIYDPDFWLHLAAGRWSLAKHAILRLNTFAFTYPEYPWRDVYWLYQIILAGIWQWFGLAGIVLWRVVLCLALLGIILLAARSELTNGAAMCVVVGWLLLAPRLTDRPELVSYVLLASMLVAATRQRWWWCLPLQIVWSNVQGYFLLGPLFVAFAGFGCWWCGQREAAGRAWLTAGLLVGCCALSPFGFDNLTLFRDFCRTMRSPELRVQELVSPFHPLVRGVDGTDWLLIVYTALVGIAFSCNARKVAGCHWLWSIATLPMAIMVRRAIPVFILSSLPALLMIAPRLDSKIMRWTIFGVCVLLAVGLRIRGQTRGVGVNTTQFPVEAVEYLQAGLADRPRVWNTDFSAGGYLIAHGIRPFIDGRLEAYPQEFLHEYLSCATNSVRFDSLTATFGVTHVLVNRGAADGDQWLRRMQSASGWALVNDGRDAALFGRLP